MSVGTCTDDRSTRDVMNSSTLGIAGSWKDDAKAGGVQGGVKGRSLADVVGVSHRMTCDAFMARYEIMSWETGR